MTLEAGGIITGAKAVVASVKDLLTMKASYDKQHIDLLKTKVQMLLDLVDSYESQNKSFAQEIESLKRQLASKLKSEEFTETQGAAFKRDSNGKYESVPYCPKCHNTLAAVGQLIPYKCSNRECGHLSNIKSNQLPGILKQLNRRFSS